MNNTATAVAGGGGRETTTFHVWEGEWLRLRKSITAARLAATRTYHSTYKLLNDDYNLVTNTKYYLAITDRRLVHVSRYLSSATHDTVPSMEWWAVPAAGISVVSTAVGLKSARRWGIVKGARNGAVSSLVLVLLLYPHEVRDGALSLAERVL